MTSREKLHCALEHKEGAIPIDFGSSSVTGIHCSIVEKLRKYYGLSNRPIKIIEPYQMLGMIEEDLCSAMGIDVRPVWNPYTIFGFKNENWKEFCTLWGQVVLVPEQFTTTEKDGKIYIYAQGDLNSHPSAVMPASGFFFDETNRQQSDIDYEALDVNDNIEEYTEISEEVLQYFAENNAIYGERTCGIVGSIGGTAIGDIALVPGPMLKAPKGIRDIEEWYISTVIRRDYLHEVFTKQTDIALKNLKKIHDVAGSLFDVLFTCGTDFGTQIGSFCAPETFRELYMPYYKKINNWIHANTNWKIFKHSCGAVESFFPLFIESGFDIINPVQWTASGMDREHLKKKYGDSLTFWGGGVDTQKTLPFGSPKDVYSEVIETCKILGQNGGFVFSSIHNIQAKTPVENIASMIEAVHDFNKG